MLLSFGCSSNKAENKTNPPFNLITEKQFNELFPRRSPFYSYAAFIKAINNLSKIKVKVDRRSVSFYQFTRTDKVTGKSTVVRQDEEWGEDWAKKKGDSVLSITPLET